MKNESILQIEPERLVEVDGWNVRLADDPDNIAHIARLAESIFNVGVLEPLTAYLSRSGDTTVGEKDASTRDSYVVTNGHCRLAAVKLAMARGAPIKTVPVRLEPKHATAADHTFGMVARNTGKNLSQLELGLACKRLLGFGWTDQQLADKSGYSVQHVRNVVLLASAPAEVTRLVETGQVSASLAIQAVQAEGGAQAAESLQAAVEIAKREDAAKPRRAPSKPAPIKATMKHVQKAKKSPSESATYARKAKTTLSAEEHCAGLRELTADRALERFDALFKFAGTIRVDVFRALLDAPQASTANQGNSRDPDLTTLGLLFGRAVADAPDGDGIVTLVMSADDWHTACKLLRIKASETTEMEAAEAS